MVKLHSVLLIVAALGMTFLLASPAVADWNEGDPNTKWVQYPDLTPNGIDVKVTAPKILADDWLCTDPRPVTDIHFWGSWKFDEFPTNAPAFRIQIWSDEPAIGQMHSRPREFLWEATEFTWAAREYYKLDPTGPGEGWYDPNTGEYLPSTDWTIWQLNIDVSKNPFYQVEGTVYWLVVQAWFPDGTQGPELGWKTCDPKSHWNDDAVWADGELFPIPGMQYDWRELRYPDKHEYAGESIDFSFVIPCPSRVRCCCWQLPA